MESITYETGDATRPTEQRPCVLAHVANDVGAWGRGFTAALDRLSEKPRDDYRLCLQRYD